MPTVTKRARADPSSSSASSTVKLDKCLSMPDLCQLLSSAVHSPQSWEALRNHPELLATLQTKAAASPVAPASNTQVALSPGTTVEIQERAMTAEEYKRELQGFEEHAREYGNGPETEDRQGFVAVDANGGFVGCSSCLVMRRIRGEVLSSAPWSFLTDLYVESTFRKQGVGSLLLQKLEDRLRGMGVRVLWTYTAGFEGPAFYSKNGYQQFVVQNEWYESGHPRVGVFKELAHLSEPERVPYLTDSECPEELATAIRARRENGQLLNLDRVLLHSPPFARGWGALFSIVRGQLTIPGKLRELAILAVGHLNRAHYECVQHEPVFFAEGGTLEQARALADLRSFTNATLFDDSERSTLALALEMTRSIEVRPATMQRVQSFLSMQQVVELIGTIAGYNLVSRFLIATGIQVETA